MLDKLTRADFAPLLHETFRIDLGDGRIIELELASATDLDPVTAADPGGRLPFSLEFLGPLSRRYLPQRIYRLENDAFGVLEIFLVPLGPVDGRMRYEAIFT